jgi:hypothetical protein
MPSLRPLVFLNKFLNFTKLDVLCPGRCVSWTFCNWTFGNWTFCILDVLYPGRSVTGRLVTGRFVTGRYVTGRFVGVPSLSMDILCLFILQPSWIQHKMFDDDKNKNTSSQRWASTLAYWSNALHRSNIRL